MGLFGTKPVKETTERDCIIMVENFFRKIKLESNQQRVTDRDTTGWWVQRGSALVYIILNEHEGLETVRIISPILYLPNENILPFYRKCLEINMDLCNCAIGVYDDKVSLISERPIEGLDPEELEGTIHYLSSVADDLDNKLADEFGATLMSETNGQ